MHGLPLVGYTAVSVAFLASLGALLRVMTRPAPATLAEALPFLLLGAAAWPLGAWAEHGAGRTALGRSLRLLSEALLPLCLLWAALVWSVGPAGLALALAAGLHVGLTVQHARADEGGDPLYAWFSAAWGALLLCLAREALAVDPATIVWAGLAYGVLLHALARRLAWPDDVRFAQAAIAVVAAVLLVVCAVHGRTPSERLLVALYASSATLTAATFWNDRLGHAVKGSGLAAYVATTATLSVTLAYLDADLYVYVAATAGWIATLTFVGAALTSVRFVPFRESAHWTAIGLGVWLAIATSALWWSAAGLPDTRFRVIGSPAEWRVLPIAPVSTIALLVVAAAIGFLAYWRRRHPPIAYTVAGVVLNRMVTVGASFLAPGLLVLGACAAWVAAGSDAAWAPLAPLVAGVVLLVWPAAERTYASPGWAAGGYLALVTAAALTWQARRGAVSFLLAGALVVLARAAWRRTRGVMIALAIALSAAAARLFRDGPDALGIALLAVGALAGYRLLARRDGERLRLGWLSGWAVAAGGLALGLALFRAPHAIGAPLVLWAGLPLVLADRRRGPGQTEYEPAVFVSDWIATAAHLLVHAAGAAAIVLGWRALGFPAADAGPLLAAWAWAHLALYGALRTRAPGAPATLAAAIASQALAAVSLALPLFSTSRRIAVATVLLDAALFFSWSDARRATSWDRALASIGHVLVALGIALGAFGGAELAAQALLGAAFVYGWHARRTGSDRLHAAFLAVATAAALVAVAARPEPPRLLPLALMAVALVGLAALAERVDGRTGTVRFTWMWALALGYAALVAGAWRSGAGTERLVPLFAVPLWIAFGVGARAWDVGTPAGAVRPGEPEDVWLALGTHWLAHAAGGASLAAILMASGRGPGVAAAALAVWAAAHWAFSFRASADDPPARRALRHAVPGLAAAALVVAAFAAREPLPALAACTLAGLVFLRLVVEGASRWLALAAAVGFVEASWLFGSRMGVDVVEYYLTAAALALYLALRLRAEPPEAAGHWMLAGPGAWARTARRALLPALVGGLLVGYPFAALLADRGNVHLFYLGAATALFLFGFWHARQAAFYTYVACGLFLGGALVVFAVRGLDAGATWFLLGSVPLVLLTVFAAGGRQPRPEPDAVGAPSGAGRAVA